MEYSTYDEAKQRMFDIVPVGSRWVKEVGGRRMVIDLIEEGKLVEWVEGHEHDTWEGNWTTGARHEYQGWLISMQIRVGMYEARLTFADERNARGYELNDEAVSQLSMEDRRLLDTTGHPLDFPRVTLSRLD